MTEDLLRYDQIVERALRGVVRTALEQISDYGLPGNHSLYIMSDVLRAEHPQEMTIVLENQFWDLEVGEENFSVTLSFNKKRERLTVPFVAVSAFADPTVQFGLKFEADGEGGQQAEEPQAESQASAEKDTGTDDKSDPKDSSDKVVALDAFRKK